jgi:hypothetical protein
MLGGFIELRLPPGQITQALMRGCQVACQAFIFWISVGEGFNSFVFCLGRRLRFVQTTSLLVNEAHASVGDGEVHDVLCILWCFADTLCHDAVEVLKRCLRLRRAAQGEGNLASILPHAAAIAFLLIGF